MPLGCRAFFHEFLAEYDKEKKTTKWEKIYLKNKEWTTKMLGDGKSRKKDDYGLIGRIGKKFGYEIQSEWRRIDQIWYHWLQKPEGWKEAPWKNDVLVEHENDIDRLEYTFIKFEELSAPLKVGIFYPGDNEKEYLEKSRQMIMKQIASYPGGVYLIIFGFLDDSKGVYWHGYEIDFKGNRIGLHT